MTIVLDSGAVIAAQQGDPRITTIIGAARNKRGTAVVVMPATVVAETWRDPVHAQIARLLKSVDQIYELDDDKAREVGDLLGRSGTAAIVDANVVKIAVTMRPSTIVTSDPNDVQALLAYEGVSYALFGKQKANTDVTVVPL